MKPVNNSSCSSLVLTSNGVDEIDFQDIWNILLDLTMLTYVSLKSIFYRSLILILLDMKLKNVNVLPSMTRTTFSELVFDRIQIEFNKIT